MATLNSIIENYPVIKEGNIIRKRNFLNLKSTTRTTGIIGEGIALKISGK